MAVGTGAVTLQNIPANPYVIDPEGFFARTRKNVISPATIPAPTPGGFATEQLLQAGIVSKIMLTFVGTLTVATAAATTSNRWPHGLLSAFRLSANGQNDLVSVDGLDLHTLRFIRYPAFVDRVDVFPGTVGGGDSIAPGTYDLHVTYEVPIAMDDTSLVGALFAQSSATNLMIRLVQATAAELFSANPGNVTIAGTWNVQETLFDIPFGEDGRIIIPDLTRLHGINAVDTPFTNVGEVRAPLIRSAGQLARVLVSARSATNNRLSAAANAAATKKITRLRMEYGGNQRPLVYDPASTLLAVNNQHYGATAPYDRMVLDFVRENPARDVVLMQGVTELNVVPEVGSGVTVTAGSTRVVQETLF